MKIYLTLCLVSLAALTMTLNAGNTWGESSQPALKRAPGAGLEDVHVYPNPYRPGSKTIYDDPSAGEGIVFAGLPHSANIKIFTISGELVKTLEVSGSGDFLWDTRNAEMQKCASGVYIYIVTSSYDPGKKKLGRFAIAE